MRKNVQNVIMTNLILKNFMKLKGILSKWKKIYIDASHPNETRIAIK